LSYVRMLKTALCAAASLVLLSGCIRKMATITSEPGCAKVWINGVYRGETPVEIPYNWNWYYDIRVVKEGYEPYCIRERFYAPGRHLVPVDFVAEIAPVRSRESQWRHYLLVPEKEL
jgi:PEGA domain